MNETLSISIPTRNRAPYLKELLQSIAEQVKCNSEILNDVKIYIFDNDSNDNTDKVVKSFDLNIFYQKNKENIGVGLNVYQAYTAAQGEYIWVIGDDEMLSKNALNTILQLITRYRPHLIINRCSAYKTFTEPWIFDDYSDFIHVCKLHNPNLLIAHSLISVNIILKKCFDEESALEKMDTYYGQFYGMARGLKKLPGLVLYPQQETVIVRTKRPGCVDGIGPKNIHREHAVYLEWLAAEYHSK